VQPAKQATETYRFAMIQQIEQTRNEKTLVLYFSQEKD
jgi:hypothetical protein